MDRPSPDRRGVALALLAAAALVLAGAAVGAGALQADQDQPDGDEVLDRMAERYEAAESVVGTATVVVANDTREASATVEFAFAEPNRSHVTVTRDGTSVEFGTDGEVAWVAGPNRSFVADLPAPDASAPLRARAGGSDGERPGPPAGVAPGANGTPDVPGAAWANRSADPPNVSAMVTGIETVDGQGAYVVALVPEFDRGPDEDSGAGRDSSTGTERAREAARDVSVTLWVATDDYRLLRAVATDGTNRTEVRMHDQRFNVSVHRSEFAPPEDRVAVTGVERFEDRAALVDATDLELPALDTGEFVAGQRITRGGTETVVQGYRAEEGNVTLVTTTAGERFEGRLDDGTTVTVGDRNATAYAVGDGTAVVWTEDGVTTAVVVEGSVEEAVAVADRV